MKSSILRALTLGINEECPNDTGVAECESDCFNLLTQCQIDCKQDFTCLSDCNREYAECGEVRFYQEKLQDHEDSELFPQGNLRKL